GQGRGQSAHQVSRGHGPARPGPSVHPCRRLHRASLTYETFGIIVIEAFARKTPVIVRDLGALPEVVEESGGGLVYRTDDQLRAAIQRLASSDALRRELGQKGYDSFVRLWSREAHLEQYFGFLRASAARKLGRVPWESSEREA